MATITKSTLIKGFELLLVCIIIGIHWHSFDLSEKATIFLGITAAGGYLIILIGLIGGAIVGTPVNRRVDLFFTIVGFVIFMVAGGLVIDYFNRFAISSSYRDKGLARGSLAIITSVVFFVDAILTFRGEA